MADSTIQNPHDGFFKETFGQVEFTREFLAKFLPRDVAACLELAGLPAVKDSFDLSGYNDEQLRSQAFIHASLLLLKYIFRPELPGELTRIFGLMAEMSEQDRSLECVRLLLGYLVQGTDRLDQETLRVALKQSLPNRGEELMPTLAEQWASQGRDQGLAEGIERGTLIGAIETCRSILGEPAGSEGLARQPLEELRQLAQRLQSQVRERLAGK
jgi:hypothetical protein